MAENPTARSALVLYGSETGNAQDLAEESGRLLQRLHFSCEVLPLDAVSPDVLNTVSITLIVISTTGQGDIPASAKAFWKLLLRKKLPATYLSRTKFALFGLGDSSYPQYNWAALKVAKRLVQLGAHEFAPRSGGDEQHPEGHDATFVPWTQTLKSRLLEILPLPEGQSPIPDDVLLQPPWLLCEREVEHDVTSLRTNGSNGTKSRPKTEGRDVNHAETFYVSIDQNHRITPEKHFQDVRHLIFQADQHMDYGPGDILTVFPKNSSDDVEQLIHLMGWASMADAEVTFGPNPQFTNSRTPAKPSFSNPHVPYDFATFREVLTSELDLNAIPRRSFFSLIAHFTDDEFQKERLLEFANPELIDELFDYTTRPRRSILEVLQEFDTLKIPWQWAAAILPGLRGRQFSIASGGSLKEQLRVAKDGEVVPKTRFELLVAIVKYRTVIKKIRRGVCTRYLESLQVGSRLPVAFQKGTLAAQKPDLALPVVMIGPGTGLAPLRALIWERWAWQKASTLQKDTSAEQQPQTNEIGNSVLFFGCRSGKADYFFEEEWQRLQSLGMPLDVFVAFSRDQDKKVYVQDRISEQHELLYKYICEQNGLIYVCGSSGKMPQAVRGALMDVMQKSGGLKPQEAEQELKRLEKAGRYKQETW